MPKWSATILRTFNATSGLVPGRQRARNSASEIGGKCSSNAPRFRLATAKRTSTTVARTATPTRIGTIAAPTASAIEHGGVCRMLTRWFDGVNEPRPQGSGKNRSLEVAAPRRLLLHPQEPVVGVEAVGEGLVSEVVRAGVAGDALTGDRDEHFFRVKLRRKLRVGVAEDRAPTVTRCVTGHAEGLQHRRVVHNRFPVARIKLDKLAQILPEGPELKSVPSQERNGLRKQVKRAELCRFVQQEERAELRQPRAPHHHR